MRTLLNHAGKMEPCIESGVISVWKNNIYFSVNLSKTATLQGISEKQAGAQQGKHLPAEIADSMLCLVPSIVLVFTTSNV